MSRTEKSRFDCWKDVADYLGHDVRTVRRWEKERGLPIYRVPGGGRSAVFAFRNEIDAWLSRKNRQSQNSDVVSRQNGIGTNSQEIPPLSISSEANEHHPSTIKVFWQSLASTSRSPVGRIAGTILAFAVLLSVSLIWIYRSARSAATDPEAPPRITSVSSVIPQPNQTIVIRGSGFGLYTPYDNADSPFIAVRDKTAGWSAGRIIPQNWDSVMLDVKSWEDKQIVLSGFSGAFGSGTWKIAPGDEIQIAVWNPQSGSGPALYHLFASAPSADEQENSGTTEEQDPPNTVKNRVPRHR